MSKETEDLAAITDRVLANSLEEQRTKGPKLRQLHPKSHGLLRGKLIVEANIPEYCRVGIFAQKQEHDIWVRFSNASPPKELGVFELDGTGDIRGMAIKVIDVEGDVLPSDESATQDFVLVNHPVFFLKDVQSYLDLSEIRTAAAQKKFPPLHLLFKLFRSLMILMGMNNKVIGNPLSIQYWSTTPYKLGSKIIKFAVKPDRIESKPTSVPDAPNYLRETIVRKLTKEQNQFRFDFLVQFYTNEAKTPIENPMQEWQERDSPFIKIATIEILPQEFDVPERREFDESLSFTPWHTLPAHEPVGSLNLSRRKVYQEVAKTRRSHL
jgi:hypothetical protein